MRVKEHSLMSYTGHQQGSVTAAEVHDKTHEVAIIAADLVVV